MLNKLIETRYCKFEQISSHLWFKGFNWNQLISLDMNPDVFPRIDIRNNNENDIKPYIDYIQTLEEWKDKNKGKGIITPEKEKEYNDWFQNF